MVNDPAGLLFAGRADDQIKLGGRRIELGEIDGQLLRLPGVAGAAAAVRTTKSGNQLLVGYLAVDDSYDSETALALLRERMPAALVPRLAVVDDLPTKTSGKVDRDALPWPLPRTGAGPTGVSELQSWIADIWADVLGAEVTSPKDDFFDFGGGSLTAAQVVGRLREQYPEVAVGDLYRNPRLGTLATALEHLGPGPARSKRTVPPIPPKTQLGQLLALLPLRTLAAGRWLAWLMLLTTLAHDVLDLSWVPTVPVWLVVLTVVIFLVPPVRMAVAALLIRGALRGVTPGSWPRGGKVHLRVWLATGSRTSWQRSRPLARPGCSGMPGCSGRGSDRTSTCTPCHRSPGCSRSARAPRSSRRWTSPATGSTATWSTSSPSASVPTPGSARAAP